MRRISKKLAQSVGDVIGVDWKKIKPEEFYKGMHVELEHGSKLGQKTNVTKDDLVTTGKIALAHLEELPDYYSRLDKMEKTSNKEDNLKEFIRQEVRRVLSEGDVLDFGAFRKRKQQEKEDQEREDRGNYYNIVVVSDDGKYVFDPGNVVIAELTHQDQADALADGDLKTAVRLGASVIPISSKLFEKYREWTGQSDDSDDFDSAS